MDGEHMQRARRLMAFWQYLPAFRVVAETEHVRRAAEMLHLSPSALSRTIGLLEQDLGLALFERKGRSLRLTREGSAMLCAVRKAMRLLDEGLTQVTSRAYSGPLRVHAPSVLLPRVAEALRPLQGEHPELVPVVTSRPDGPVDALLVRGDLDLALLFRARPSEGVELLPAATLPWSVCCGARHPFAWAKSLTAEQVMDAPFAALLDAPEGEAPLWPAGPPKRVVFATDDLATLLTICERGEVLAILPDVAVAAAPGLKGLPQPRLPAVPVHAVRRSRLAPDDLVDRALALVREALGGEADRKVGNGSGAL